MIPEQQTQKTVVDTIGGEEIAFSIKSIANVFELLRNSMYNDKPTAVAREIISNAIDANIESRTDKKVLIKFPTKFDQIFSIQDFGIGIDKERMLCLTAFGASTKTSTNNQIGGFGLGVKSPWSISDQFTITTINGGIKYKYLCYLDDGGYGRAKELFAIPTDEASGTTVEIPVTNTDYIDRIEKQAELFWLCNPDKISIIDRPEIDIYKTLQHTVALRGFLPSNYHVFNWLQYGLGDKVIVLNGYVPYIIHHRSFNEWKIDRSYTYVVKYDIGVLDIPATREAISNTKKNNRITGKIIPTIKQSLTKLFSFLMLRKEKDERIAAITTRHSPVKIPDEIIDYRAVHSNYYYSNYSRCVTKNDVRYASPSSPTSCINVNNEIIVELDDSKKSNISFKQYAEHIIDRNPNVTSVYFVLNGELTEKEKRIFKVVPLHTFAPTPVKRQVTRKTKEELIESEEDQKSEIFYVYRNKLSNHETLEDILKEPEKYRKIECFAGGIIDEEIKKHFQRFRSGEASCSYGLFLVNKGMMKYTKDVKSVEVIDFTLSESVYFHLAAAYFLRYLSLMLRKSKLYEKSAICVIREYLDTNHIIPSGNKFIQTTYSNDVKLIKGIINNKTQIYKLDETRFDKHKRLAFGCAKKLLNLMTDIRYWSVINSINDYSSHLKESVWKEYSGHILDIFLEYKEMFK